MLTLNDIILLQALFSKYEPAAIIQCPSCSNHQRIYRHGSYQRQHLLGLGQETIPRFRCLNPLCKRQTFSILAFPYLRWVRHRLIHLLLLLAHLNQGTRVSELSRWWNRARAVIRRALNSARQLNRLLNQEIRAGTWAHLPWFQVTLLWTPFTQAASHALYPLRQIPAMSPHKSSMGEIRPS